jgi:hypothetical protein
MTKHTIIIVHPFTSDKFLYKTIKERGYTIITLITPFDQNWIKLCMDTVNEYSDFILNVTNDVAADLVAIRKVIDDNQLELKGVINAFDYSLEYSDSLTNELLHVDIDLKYSKIRCNKFNVNDELAKNSKIPVIKSTTVEYQANWQKNLSNKLEGFKYPVIIKPASDSAARMNMEIASNVSEVEKKLDILFTQANIFSNQVHTSFIIQEYIEGDEFVVNSIAINNQHQIAGVLKNKKEGSRFLGLISITSDDIAHGLRVVDYHNQCMQHLKFTYGMVHAEYIIDDKSGQPYLLEVNNRISGANIPYISNKCYHVDEVNLFLDLLECKKEVTQFDFAKIFSYGVIPYFSNYTNPDATKLDLFFVQSEHGVVVFKPGIVIKANRSSGDVFDSTSSGIWLLNDNLQVLHKELEMLRNLEQTGKLFI